MEFDKLPWRERKSRLLPLAASLCIERYGLTLRGIDKGIGESNDFSYTVEAWDSRFQIRLFSPRTSMARMESILALQSFVSQAGLSVPDVTPGLDSEPIQPIGADRSLGGFHACIVHPWIHATAVQDLDEAEEAYAATAIGRQVAAFHNASSSYGDTTSLSGKTHAELETWMQHVRAGDVYAIDEEFDLTETPTDALLDHCQRLYDWLTSLESDRFGAIHGDLTCDNILVQDGTVHIIDWWLAARAPFEFDLVKVLDFGVSPDMPDQFLAGYSSVRDLPPDLDATLAMLRQTRMAVPNWF